MLPSPARPAARRASVPKVAAETYDPIRRSQLVAFWRTHAKLMLGHPLTAGEEEDYLLLAPLAFGGIESDP